MTDTTPTESAAEDAGSVVSGAKTVKTPFDATSAETLIERALTAYLAKTVDDRSITLAEIRDALLQHINGAMTLENKGRKDAYSSSPPTLKLQALDEMTVVRVLLARRRIVAINLSGSRSADDTVLAMYCEVGPDEGLYLASDAPIAQLVSEIRPSSTANAIESTLKRLKIHAAVVTKTTDAHLVPVANGVFDHDQQVLLPFSPDFVFLAKSPVVYDQDAENPVIDTPHGDEWDVETWIQELSADEGVPELLWEILSAVVRPGVRWNKAAFFHSSRGNNGKGTLCGLMRGLVGPDGHASVPIANFGKPFALSELVHARAIIVDENSVGAFAKDLGDFKSVVTGDAFTLDRKYKSPVTVSFSGMVVQCVNDFPKSRDKSSSYTRRQLFVPFKKWFGGTGVERSYIKKDYLQRAEVLRYVLKRVLHMTHTQFSNPQACQDLLAQVQRENNPVRDFCAHFGLLDVAEPEEKLVWDLQPTAFLFDLFISWYRKAHPSGAPMNRNDFASQLVEILADSGLWRPTQSLSGEPGPERPKGRMDATEPLIAQYDLDDWTNKNYTGTDPIKMCMPAPLRTSYRGWCRV